jgi:hypothetical protein
LYFRLPAKAGSLSVLAGVDHSELRKHAQIHSL